MGSRQRAGRTGDSKPKLGTWQIKRVRETSKETDVDAQAELPTVGVTRPTTYRLLCTRADS